MKKKSSEKMKFSNANNTTIKVRDFINLIRIWEGIFQNPLFFNSSMSYFLKDLRLILNGCKELNEDEFLNILKSSISSYSIDLKDKKVQLPDNIEKMTLEELKILLSKNALSKEELLILGEKRFGLPSGTYKRLKKNDLRKLVENSLDNMEKLNIIEKKASEL